MVISAKEFLLRFNLFEYFHAVFYTFVDLPLISALAYVFIIMKNKKSSYDFVSHVFEIFVLLFCLELIIYNFTQMKNLKVKNYAKKCLLKYIIIFLSLSYSLTRNLANEYSNYAKLDINNINFNSGPCELPIEYIYNTANENKLNVSKVKKDDYFTTIRLDVNVTFLDQLYSENYIVPIDYYCSEEGVHSTRTYLEPIQVPKWTVDNNYEKPPPVHRGGINIYFLYTSCFFSKINLLYILLFVSFLKKKFSLDFVVFSLASINSLDIDSNSTLNNFVNISILILTIISSSSLAYEANSSVIFLYKTYIIKKSLMNKNNCLVKMLLFNDDDFFKIKLSRSHITLGDSKIKKSTFLKLYLSCVFMKNRDDFSLLDRFKMFFDDTDLMILRDDLVGELFKKQGFVKDYKIFTKFVDATSPNLELFRKKCVQLSLPTSTKFRRLNAFLYRNIMGKETSFTLRYPGDIVSFKYQNKAIETVSTQTVLVKYKFEKVKINGFTLENRPFNNYFGEEVEAQHKTRVNQKVCERDNLNDSIVSSFYKKPRFGAGNLSIDQIINITDTQAKKIERMKSKYGEYNSEKHSSSIKKMNIVKAKPLMEEYKSIKRTNKLRKVRLERLPKLTIVPRSRIVSAIRSSNIGKVSKIKTYDFSYNKTLKLEVEHPGINIRYVNRIAPFDEKKTAIISTNSSTIITMKNEEERRLFYEFLKNMPPNYVKKLKKFHKVNKKPKLTDGEAIITHFKLAFNGCTTDEERVMLDKLNNIIFDES